MTFLPGHCEKVVRARTTVRLRMQKAPAKKTVGLLKCDACRQHRRCQYETGTSARPGDSSRTNSMSVHSAYNVGRVVGRVQDRKVAGPSPFQCLSLKITGGLGLLRCEGSRHTQGSLGNDVSATATSICGPLTDMASAQGHPPIFCPAQALGEQSTAARR